MALFINFQVLQKIKRPPFSKKLAFYMLH